jgi:hypothetical protein
MRIAPPPIDDDRLGKSVRWVPDDGPPVGRYLLLVAVIVVAVAIVMFLPWPSF